MPRLLTQQAAPITPDIRPARGSAGEMLKGEKMPLIQEPTPGRVVHYLPTWASPDEYVASDNGAPIVVRWSAPSALQLARIAGGAWGSV